VKVLVTAGGTEEALDGVRRLANSSTGATGLTLTRALAGRGAEVVLLHAARIDVSGVPADAVAFQTFEDLESHLEQQLGTRHFDAVIHLAAVSDYRLSSIEIDGREVNRDKHGKIGSGHELVLRLSPNPKLIDRLKTWSLNPYLRVVGFKLTDNPDRDARLAQVNALLERGTADLVVHNDIREIDGSRHLAAIHSRQGLVETSENKQELAEALIRLLGTGDTS
jgi:phosphopantothenoylcysteine decarboxylase/phosphopantothenate--cysteine ligase